MKADERPSVSRPSGLASGATASVGELFARLCKGEMRALARAVSLVEDDAPEARILLSQCFPTTGAAIRIGITGAPGAGKSTLVDRLARHSRSAGQSVAVVAVDPSSPFSGGAILGDRIRMRAFEHDDGFYMRSMATRGSLGGLARATADVCTVIEASGKERILIETVGVGQAEIDIVRLADVTIVVLMPGAGDDVQSMKAGVMEIADIFVVNKSDREGADRLEKEIRAMQSFAQVHGSWIPPVVRTVASEGKGIAELAEAVSRFEGWLAQENRLLERRERYWRERILEMIRNEVLVRMRERGIDAETLAEISAKVARRELDPYQLVPELIKKLF